jgi:hypothetical protein
MWNGPLLYLFFTATDPDITTASNTDTSRSSVQIYVDQYNDKFTKFEEDDGYIIISAAGQQIGNNTNARLKYHPTNWFRPDQAPRAGRSVSSTQMPFKSNP